MSSGAVNENPDRQQQQQQEQQSACHEGLPSHRAPKGYHNPFLLSLQSTLFFCQITNATYGKREKVPWIGLGPSVPLGWSYACRKANATPTTSS